MKTFIKKSLIEDYLKEKNLSRETFAKMCRIPFKTLNNILSGRKSFYISDVFKISKVLEVDMTELFD